VANGEWPRRMTVSPVGLHEISRRFRISWPPGATNRQAADLREGHSAADRVDHRCAATWSSHRKPRRGLRLPRSTARALRALMPSGTDPRTWDLTSVLARIDPFLLAKSGPHSKHDFALEATVRASFSKALGARQPSFGVSQMLGIWLTTATQLSRMALSRVADGDERSELCP
jgi:hypothetical protein